MTVFKQIRNLVAQIPQGKVTTYGAVARAIGISDNRKVGWALHANHSPQIPCHRVVFKDGSLAPHYAFGGEQEQRKRLRKDSIKFTDTDKVDLKKYFWKPT